VPLSAGRPTTTSDDERLSDAERLDQLADAANADTPVAELGLSGAVTSTLERLGLGDVRQLLDYPTIEWNRAPGVGLQVRREVLDAIGRLRARNDLDAGDPAASIDRLADQLLPKPAGSQITIDADALRLLLGLDTDLPPSLAFPTDDRPPPDQSSRPTPAWPGLPHVDLKASLGLDRAALDVLISRARNRWVKQPGITQVRNELHTIIERSGKVLSGDDLALALAAQRVSTATGPDRLRRARAVVRAALEAEAARDSNRFTWRRLGGGASAVVALRTDALEGEEVADFAASLGVTADNLAAGGGGSCQ
jgi:hypothetical protein